ncbi:hypothetical protein Q9L42_010470 [Methylomarinum sp. Ch1-1]|uniref:Uncharacterized protein n=1 Tax=Methylomarinum roseum TaxID=3067653 RepID=A0AAU7NPC1_9GAMM|nr:hypothetical protein [Methylomarinum sp. Ch1-1]MDP4521321.1 hypothetical protein [Methylomarinum sp. Ch1-1]
MKHKKFTPYGAMLAARQQFNNPPDIVVVCVGQNGWAAAKSWNAQQGSDALALVLPPGEPPERFRWPVSNCFCLVEWSSGPGRDLIIKLVEVLLSGEALSVTVIPKFSDFKRPAWVKIGDEWRQQREVIRTYNRVVR